jgi:hypothetical protein
MSKIIDPTTGATIIEQVEAKPLSEVKVEAANDPKALEEIAKLEAEMKAEAPLDFIFTSKNYFNQTGLRIEEYELISGKFPKGFPKFVAHGFVVITLPTPQGKILKKGEKPPQHKQPLDLPVEAINIIDAFIKAPALLQAAAEKFQEQFEEDMKNRFAQAQLQKKSG